MLTHLLGQHIMVGMSGGVDSSVVAVALKKAGHRVTGLFMKNWEEAPGEECPAQQDFADVQAVCEAWDIPYYGVNFAREYWDLVFQEFLDDVQAGLTPNPDILCNREIKFKVFFDYARSLGADWVATGHYARSDGRSLFKGLDADKDQSYFLHAIDPRVLAHTLFPLGEVSKRQVRAWAQEWQLATHSKKDSVGICFIGEKNFKPFLQRYLASAPGPLCRLSGEVVGEHSGHPFYTLGQRKGLGLGGQGEPWFVVGKNRPQNIVYVERGGDHPALYSQGLRAREVHWLVDRAKLDWKRPLACKIRYRQRDQWAWVTPKSADTLQVRFEQPQRAVTPAQSIVFYQDEQCLGGAKIECALGNLWEQQHSVELFR